MFDKKVFSEILTKIYKAYNNQRDFAHATGVNRAYLSQYMNQKLDNPPSPKVLVKIANNSKHITSYQELMDVCGYNLNSSNTPSALRFLDKKMKELEKNKNDSIKELNLSRKEMLISSEICLAINDGDDLISQIDELLNNYTELSQESKKKIKKYSLIKFNYIDSFSKLVLDDSSNKVEEKKDFYMCPVYGKISAGLPNWAEECLEGYLPIDPNLMGIINPEECFFLRVDGESMNKVIRNGAYALIRKQDIVENGEIAAVLVNGFDATLKKFSKQGDLVILEPMSEDSSFTTQVYNKDTQINILGKYIGKFEMN